MMRDQTRPRKSRWRILKIGIWAPHGEDTTVEINRGVTKRR